MIKKVLNKTRGILSKRNKNYAKAVAKASIAEGKRLGKLAIYEIKKEAPKAKKVLKKEAKTFSSKIKNIRR